MCRSACCLPARISPTCSLCIPAFCIYPWVSSTWGCCLAVTRVKSGEHVGRREESESLKRRYSRAKKLGLDIPSGGTPEGAASGWSQLDVKGSRSALPLLSGLRTEIPRGSGGAGSVMKSWASIPAGEMENFEVCGWRKARACVS